MPKQLLRSAVLRSARLAQKHAIKYEEEVAREAFPWFLCVPCLFWPSTDSLEKGSQSVGLNLGMRLRNASCHPEVRCYSRPHFGLGHLKE